MKRIKKNLSIIIPVYLASNELAEMTEKVAIKSLIENYNQQDLEIILVDDKSPDVYVAEQIVSNAKDKGLSIRLLKNKKNIGFGMSVNKGVEAAQGMHILILNNDIYLPRGVCDRLIQYLKDFNLGMIGPSLSDAHGYKAQQVDSPKFIKNYFCIDYQLIEEFAKKIDETNKNNLIEVNFLMGSCMLTTKNIWLETGGIDPHYGKGYVEEVDLQVRIRKLGYKIAVARDTFVLHESVRLRSPSFSISKMNRKWLLTKNSFLFLMKNGFKENWQLNYDWHHRTKWKRLS